MSLDPLTKPSDRAPALAVIVLTVDSVRPDSAALRPAREQRLSAHSRSTVELFDLMPPVTKAAAMPAD